MTDAEKRKLLGLFDLKEGYTDAELRRAYKDMVQVWHPDRFTHSKRLQQKAEIKIKELNIAYAELKQIRSKPKRVSSSGRPQPKTKNSMMGAIFHATDFSPMGEVAFVHALKLALSAKTQLNTLHVAKDRSHKEGSGFPSVLNTLKNWGLLNKTAGRKDIAKLGFNYKNIVGVHEDPVSSILHFLSTHPAEITVLATHQKKGADRWLHKPVAEPVSRGSDGTTLFIPANSKGFVSKKTGKVKIKNVLIPIDTKPSPAVSITAISTLLNILAIDKCEFTLLYVSDRSDTPSYKTGSSNGWNWKQIVRKGKVIPTILETSDNINADLIVMATEGHTSFLDTLRGSTTEQVLRKSRVPLFAVPEQRI